MTTLNELQDKMQQQMQQQKPMSNSDNMSEAASKLSMASDKLASMGQNSNQQQQQLIQTIQQQSFQIQSLSMQLQTLTNNQRTQSAMPMIPPVPPPPNAPPVQSLAQPVSSSISAGFNMIGSGMGMVGGYAMGRSQDIYGHLRGGWHNARVQTAPVAGSSPGLIHAPYSGLLSSAIHGSGISWNPTNAQGYNFGAYQRSANENFGRGMISNTHALMGMATDGMGFGGAGAIGGSLAGAAIGQALIPIPGIGALIGGTVGGTLGGGIGSKLDVFNPIHYGMKEIDRQVQYGQNANVNSFRFLRGAGERGNAFGISEEADVGRRMSRILQKDLTYTNEDIQELQEGFVESDLMLGVDSSQKYAQRIKKLLETSKTLSKTLQMTNQETIQFMDQMFNQVGANPGKDMSLMATRVLSGASVSGLTTAEMANVMTNSAGRAGSFGLMNMTGALTGMSGRALAGQAAERHVGTGLLASVGGTSGLSDVLSTAQGRYMQGAGGDLMLRGGGGNVFNRMSNLGNNMGGSGGMLGYLANRHTEMNNAVSNNPEGVNVEMIKHISDIASSMGATGAEHTDLMKLIAVQSYGLTPIEADALVQSAGAMVQTLQKQRTAANQGVSDARYDHLAERYGIRGRVSMFMRNSFVGQGGLAVADGVSNAYASIGSTAQNAMQRMQDKFYGIDERVTFGYDMSDQIRKSDFGSLFNNSNASSGDLKTFKLGRLALDKSNKDFASVQDVFNDGLSNIVSSRGEGGVQQGKYGSYNTGKPNVSGDIRKMKQALKAAKTRQAGTKFEIESIDDVSDISNEELLKAMSGSGQYSNEQIEAFADAVGMDPKSLNMNLAFESEADTAQNIRSVFGDKAGKGSTIFEGKVTNEKLNYAADDKEFQRILSELEVLSSMRDYSKDMQSDEYYEKAGYIEKLIQTMKDPESRRVLTEMLKEVGVELTTEGKLDVSGAVQKMKEKHGSWDGHTLGKEFSFFGKQGDVGKMLDKHEKSRLAKGQIQALETGAAGLGFSSTIISQGGKSSVGIVQAMAASKYDVERLVSSDDATERRAGKYLQAVRNGHEVSSEEANTFMQSLGSLGASGGAGVTQFSGAKMDADMLGAKTISEMGRITDINSQQIAVMEKILKKMGVSTAQ